MSTRAAPALGLQLPGHASDPSGPTLDITRWFLLSGIVQAATGVSQSLALLLHKMAMNQLGEMIIRARNIMENCRHLVGACYMTQWQGDEGGPPMAGRVFISPHTMCLLFRRYRWGFRARTSCLAPGTVELDFCPCLSLGWSVGYLCAGSVTLFDVNSP